MGRITILGMGHGGSAMAADLSLRGHEVTLVKTSDAMHTSHHQRVLESGEIRLQEGGTFGTARLFAATDAINRSVIDADIVVVFVQTTFHEELLQRILPHLKEDTLLLFEPGYLSTAYVLKLGAPYSITVAEATSSPIDCRITSPGEVTVSFRNVANHVGIFPRSSQTRAAAVLDGLGYRWIYMSSPIEAALHNPNLIVHTVGAIMSIPRIEYTGGDYWMYREVFTPTVWNLVEALDSEKKGVLAALGFDGLDYVDACRQRNSTDQTQDAKSVFLDYARNSSVAGPSEVRSRYITEDVPQGLVLLESLGELLDVPTPVCSSLIELASAALGTDFRGVGRNVSRLGKSNLARLFEDAGFSGIAGF